MSLRAEGETIFLKIRDQPRDRKARLVGKEIATVAGSDLAMTERNYIPRKLAPPSRPMIWPVM